MKFYSIIILILFIIICIYYSYQSNIKENFYQCATLGQRLLCNIRCRDVQDITRKWQCLTHCCSPV
jgi:hypothetical protein